MVLWSWFSSLTMSDTTLDATQKQKFLQEDILIENIKWKAIPLYSTLGSFLQKRLFKH